MLLRSSHLIEVPLCDDFVALSHILGTRRTICDNRTYALLKSLPVGPNDSRQGEAREIQLDEQLASQFDYRLLVGDWFPSEDERIRQVLNVDFSPPPAGLVAGVTRFLSERPGVPRRLVRTHTRPEPDDPAAVVGLDTPLYFSQALTWMEVPERSYSIVTHLLTPPLLLRPELLKLALAFRQMSTVAEARGIAQLDHLDDVDLVEACRFLVRRKILWASAAEEMRCIERELRPVIARAEPRKAGEPDLPTFIDFEKPQHLWHQPSWAFGLSCVRRTSGVGAVALLGGCHAQFLGGALQYLAQASGWHLEIHGLLTTTPELRERDWSAVVLFPTALAAGLYQAMAVEDERTCRQLIPQIVSAFTHAIAGIREHTPAPLAVMSFGPPGLSITKASSAFQHRRHQIFAELNGYLVEELRHVPDAVLLDESAHPRHAGIVFDDEFNSLPHHSGCDIWALCRYRFGSDRLVLPPKDRQQIHPALPLASLCLDYLQRLYVAPPVRLVIFDPDWLLWPGTLAIRKGPHPKDLHVYAAVEYFFFAGINEALCALKRRGIRLACLSSTPTELLRERWHFTAPARNLVRLDDVDVALGGEDKESLLAEILAQTGVRPEDTLLIDYGLTSLPRFPGRRYSGDRWALRRYLLTAPELDPAPPEVESRSASEPPADMLPSQGLAVPVLPHSGEPPLSIDELTRQVDAVLCDRLRCSPENLAAVDDLRLLGLDSFRGLEIAAAIEARLGIQLSDHHYVPATLFFRSGLLGAVLQSQELAAEAVPHAQIGSSAYSYQTWCGQDVASIIRAHVERPRARWILKIVHSAESFDHEYVSWRQLDAAAKGYTKLFRDMGFGRGDVVEILLPHGLPLVASVLGAIFGGLVPAVSAFPSDKLSHSAFFEWFAVVVGRSETKCIVCTESLRAAIGSELHTHGLTLPIVTDVPVPDRNVSVLASEPDAPLLLQHTSGTTGLKKGVLLTHRQVLAQTWNLAAAIGCQSSDIVVSWLPLYHDMGLMGCLFMPLLFGIPVVMMSPFDWVAQPHMLLREISIEAGTICWLPNFAFLHIANRVRSSQLEGLSVTSMRRFISSSEPLSAHAMKTFFNRLSPWGLRFSSLASSYGMAENTLAVTMSVPDRPSTCLSVKKSLFLSTGIAEPVDPEDAGRDGLDLVSSGRLLPRTELRVVDENGERVADRTVGHIEIRSDSLIAGYFNDADATSSAFIDGWYRSGDLGFVSDGELFVTGRSKDLIIVGGHNVYPHDVEESVGHMPGIKPGRVVAFGVHDESEGTEQLVIVAETIAGLQIDEDGLKQDIRELIRSLYFVSVHDVRFVPTGSLRKSTSGKISRSANREFYLATPIGTAAVQQG